MPRPIFISYARNPSAPEAQALKAKLADRAFLDTTAIQDGDRISEQVLQALLVASTVVIFATEAYARSLYCRLEMRLAVTAGAQIVVARGEGWTAVGDCPLASLPR